MNVCMTRSFRVLFLGAGLATAGACGSSPTQPTATPTPTAAPVVLSAPATVSPANGASKIGWPTFTVNNAAKSGAAGAITYKFDISTSSSFATIAITGTVPETPNQTSYTPPASTAAPAQGTLYWRATAIDATNNVTSPASASQTFVYLANTPQNQLALQAGYVLWPNAQPTGTYGHATLGPGWDVGMRTSFNGVTFLSPEIEQLRVYDLIDLGYDPDSALNWMRANGYATVGVYYASVQVIGFYYNYMAYVNGAWELVFRVGA